jgi:hypothetical protein
MFDRFGAKALPCYVFEHLCVRIEEEKVTGIGAELRRDLNEQDVQRHVQGGPGGDCHFNRVRACSWRKRCSVCSRSFVRRIALTV